MKIICIDNNLHLNGKDYAFALTIGKEYNANIKTDHKGITYYTLVNDCKQFAKYPLDHFNTKEAFRNQKLEELGI